MKTENLLLLAIGGFVAYQFLGKAKQGIEYTLDAPGRTLRKAQSELTWAGYRAQDVAAYAPTWAIQQVFRDYSPTTPTLKEVIAQASLIDRY